MTEKQNHFKFKDGKPIGAVIYASDNMSKKRFTETLSTGIVTDHLTGKEYNCEMRIDDELLECLNALHEENQFLKQSNEDARQILKKEFDFATEQRQKHLDDPVVANAYDIIRYDMRRALDKLGGYDE